MTRIVTSLLASTAFIGLVTAAQAADMGSPLRGPAVVQPLTESSSSGGWYLRGDVGLAIAGRPSLEDYDGGVPAGKSFIQRDMTDAPKIMLGVGYQFNDYLRGDLTAEYMGSSRLRGTAIYDSTYSGLTSVNYQNYDTHINAATFLANGYIDLGKYSGFTPYVGAGVGASYVYMGDVTSDNTAYIVSSTGNYPTPAERGIMGATGKWNFAWALHTGMSWDVTQNFKVDMGYTYKNLGKVTSGNINCFSGATGCNEQLTAKNLAFHDIHIGARWMLDSAPAKTPVYSAPVVAKY
ncbi:MAG: porin family protein [Phyllobacteriaceae bacterium]|nr:porin family protein [Phyllobacteriaceae bacterium]